MIVHLKGKKPILLSANLTREENTQHMDECCDALKDDQLICVDDLGDEGGKYSRNYSKQEMAEFLKDADKLIPFDLKQICNKYESVFNDIRKEETNQVSKTTGTNSQEGE